jgi:predicted transcriptional regulator
MEKLNEILHELGISKVKLAKYLGVSRQMIYNYLELDDINKWPKDKKVLLLNLLGIKTPADLAKIKVDTDYILDVEARINSLFQNSEKINGIDGNSIFNNMGKKQQELLKNVIDLLKEKLDDESDVDGYNVVKYLNFYLQALDNAKELKYILGYVGKAMGLVKPLEFVFAE